MPERMPVGRGAEAGPIVVSVIIATYNASGLLDDCLRSIYANPPSERYEIIVVDDASTDRSSDMVREKYPDVVLFTNKVNSHYATSNNLAFKHARGEFFFLLNNDTIVLPNAIDLMVAFLREHPDAGSVGSKLLNEDGSIQWSVKTLPNIGSAFFGARSFVTRIFPNNPFSREHLQHLSHDLTKSFVAGYVSSASVMMPRRVVMSAGDLDRRLSYHVDADYCKRISDLGYNNYYLPEAVVIHLNHRGGTMVHWRRRFRSVVEFHRGSYIYYDKHMRETAPLPMRAIVVVGLLFRFVVSLAMQALMEAYSVAVMSGRRLIGGSHRKSAS
jgi:N-acetylglucosaminyl-diphospho-decaprenol L-rhamnosyltransferase